MQFKYTEVIQCHSLCKCTQFLTLLPYFLCWLLLWCMTLWMGKNATLLLIIYVFFIDVLYIELDIQVCRYTSIYGILSTAVHRYTCLYAYTAFLLKKLISRSENYVSYEVWQNIVSIAIPFLVQWKALDTNSCITSFRESTFLICYWIKVGSFIVSASVA